MLSGKLIQTAALLLAVTACARAASLGYADGYNVLVFTTLKDTSDIGGRAAAGTYFVGEVVVGNHLTSSSPNVDVVAGQGIQSGGQIQVNSGGNAYVPGGTVGGSVLMNGGGKLVTTDPINFAAAQSYYQTMSTQLSGLAATGTIAAGKIAATSSSVNVFNLTAAQFDSLSSITTDGGTVIINVAGTPAENNFNMTVDGNQVSTNTIDNKVLFNFYQDSGTVTLGNSFGGSVLAPWATVSGADQYDGTIVANALNFTGEIHGDGEFAGTVPMAPEPGSTGLLGLGITGVGLAIRRFRRGFAKELAS